MDALSGSGGVLSFEQGEERRHLGKPQDAPDGFANVDQDELLPRSSSLLVSGDEDPEAGHVDEPELLQIDHEDSGLASDPVDHAGEIHGRGEIQLAADVDDGRAVVLPHGDTQICLHQPPTASACP